MWGGAVEFGEDVESGSGRLELVVEEVGEVERLGRRVEELGVVKRDW